MWNKSSTYFSLLSNMFWIHTLWKGLIWDCLNCSFLLFIRASQKGLWFESPNCSFFELVHNEGVVDLRDSISVLAGHWIYCTTYAFDWFGTQYVSRSFLEFPLASIDFFVSQLTLIDSTSWRIGDVFWFSHSFFFRTWVSVIVYLGHSLAPWFLIPPPYPH